MLEGACVNEMHYRSVRQTHHFGHSLAKPFIQKFPPSHHGAVCQLQVPRGAAGRIADGL